jgi:hypothetical protein
LSPAQEKQLTDAHRLAGTLFAVTVIEGLLEYSESYKRHFRGKPDPISPWPLAAGPSPSQRPACRALSPAAVHRHAPS